MSLLLWGAALLLGGAAVVYFWDNIMEVYKEYISPWIREKCGDKVWLTVNMCLGVLDKTTTAYRRGMKTFFNNTIRKYKCEYALGYANENIRIKEIVVVKDENGEWVQGETTSFVDPWKVGSEILKILKSYEVVEIDIKKEVLKKMDELKN